MRATEEHSITFEIVGYELSVRTMAPVSTTDFPGDGERPYVHVSLTYGPTGNGTSIVLDLDDARRLYAFLNLVLP